MPPWLIALLGALLTLLYPFQTLVDAVIATSRGDALTTAYLRNLMRTDPQNPELRLMLARQQFVGGELTAAQATVQPVVAAVDPELRADGLWLDWLIAEQRLLSLEPGSAQRQQQLSALRRELRELAQLPWPDTARVELARKAMVYGERELALSIYDKLARGKSALGVGGYAQAATVALGEGDYRGAAELYLTACDRAVGPAQRREYFLAALRALQSGDRNSEALALAEKELKDLAGDRDTLIYLIDLARAANRLDIADKYARKLLRLSLLEQWRRVMLARWGDYGGAATLRRVAFSADNAPEKPGPELPFDDHIYTLGYDVFLANGKQEDAYRVAASAVRQVPDNMAWRERLAKIAEWSGRPKVALDNWLVLARRTGSEEAWGAVQRLAPGLFDDDALIFVLKHRLARHPGDVRLVKEIAAAYERLGKPREAFAFLRHSAGAQPPSALLQEMAALAERMGEDDPAIALYWDLIRRDGVTAARTTRLAVLLLIHGRKHEAFAALDGAKDKVADEDESFWRLYAQVARSLQEDAAAVVGYEKVLRRPQAEEADYDALIALLRDDHALQAARVAETAWRKFGKQDKLLLALNLLASQEQWRDMVRLFDALNAEQHAQLQANAEFLQLRAQHYRALGRPALAQRGLQRALALQPDSPQVREALLWLLVDGNDSVALKALLARHEQAWRNEPALHDALAGAHLALSAPALALRYLTPQLQRRRGDFLWLMNYADVLEQNADIDRAWRLRQELWRTRPWRKAASDPDGADIGDRELAAARRAARARLTISQNPGDSALAVLRELLRTDFQEGQTLSAPAREVVLAWWQSHGEYEAQRGFLWQQYARNMARPLWAEISVALAQDDVAQIGALLDRYGERLPRYDRVNAAQRTNEATLAATYAYETRTVQPDDDETHLQLTETLLDQAHFAGLSVARRKLGPLTESERGPADGISHRPAFAAGVGCRAHRARQP